MKVTERKIRALVRNILLEQSEDWIDDDSEDDEKEVSSYKKYTDLLKIAVAAEKANLSSIKGKLTQKELEFAVKVLDNTKIIISDETKDPAGGLSNPEEHTFAYVLHIGFDKQQAIKGFEMTGTPDGPESKRNYEDYKKKPFQNPRVVIIKKNFDSRNITDKQRKEILRHELNHIRNNAIKVVSEKGTELNKAEVIASLRDDLVGKSEKEYIETFIDEGYFKDDRISVSNAKNYINLIKPLYDRATEEGHETSIDELAVRINSLKYSGLDYSDLRGKPFNSMQNKHGYEIAQIIPILTKTNTKQMMDKVVKVAQEIDTKSG